VSGRIKVRKNANSWYGIRGPRVRYLSMVIVLYRRAGIISIESEWVEGRMGGIRLGLCSDMIQLLSAGEQKGAAVRRAGGGMQQFFCGADFIKNQLINNNYEKQNLHSRICLWHAGAVGDGAGS
jgi:hypothetical protein